MSLATSNPEKFKAFLESKETNKITGRYSLLFRTSKKQILAFNSNQAQKIFSKLNKKIKSKPKYKLPFYSGWFLYLGYESVKFWEPSLKNIKVSKNQPIIVAIKCNSAVITDHVKQKSWAVGSSKKKVRKLISLINLPKKDKAKKAEHYLVKNTDKDNYLKSVEKAKKYIKEGDVYQVNLARIWKASFEVKPDIYSLYKSLSEHNPSPFAGFLNTKQLKIVSSSPERLVSVNKRVIESRPIAGTRPRGKTPDADELMKKELIINPKEQAEHIMLIDLVRNDIGKVCKAGTVEVDELMSIESYRKVHHIVSNVKGFLKKGVTFKDVIEATFPGGTITGCPKIRCMQIIDELETEARGVYTGSMGYVSNHGDMDLNILIRTISINSTEISIKAGAGVVYDSIPENEAKESEYKAQAMINSLVS